MRFRLAAVSAVVFSLVAIFTATQAQAAAEVHRLNLVLAGIPTQVAGGDFNDAIDYFNKARLTPRGLEELKHPDFTWGYEAELRYFVRQNVAVTAGVSQIRVSQKNEYLPAISQSVDVRAEILTVPIHVGALYYMQAYNQGDFQARAYLGGGLVQYTHTRASFQQTVINPDSVLNYNWSAPNHPEYGSNYQYVLTQDAPGAYVEGGAHMFFAARYSMMIAAVYRTGVMRGVRLDKLEAKGNVLSSGPSTVATNSKGQPMSLDVGGVGVKFAVGIGF